MLLRENPARDEDCIRRWIVHQSGCLEETDHARSASNEEDCCRYEWNEIDEECSLHDARGAVIDAPRAYAQFSLEFSAAGGLSHWCCHGALQPTSHPGRTDGTQSGKTVLGG